MSGLKIKTFKALERGDIIRHKTTKGSYVVNGNYGDHVTISWVGEASNPGEWERICKTCKQVEED